MAAHTHSTAIELSEPAPAEVAAGSELMLKIKLTCAAGCDLHNLPLTITSPDDTAPTAGHINDSGEVTLSIPPKVGPQSFTIAFGPQETDHIRHEPCALSLTVNSIPHGTSLAVWDIPSPIVKGERFTIKVGAKSAANAELNGLEIAVFDNSDKVAARGRLRDTTWPGTSALYWDEVELTAPTEEGLRKWSVRFAAEDRLLQFTPRLHQVLLSFPQLLAAGLHVFTHLLALLIGQHSFEPGRARRRTGEFSPRTARAARGSASRWLLRASGVQLTNQHPGRKQQQHRFHKSVLGG